VRRVCLLACLVPAHGGPGRELEYVNAACGRADGFIANKILLLGMQGYIARVKQKVFFPLN